MFSKKISKEDAVELMSKTVEEANRRMAAQNMSDPAQIEHWLKEQYYPIRIMCGEIYDALKSKNII